MVCIFPCGRNVYQARLYLVLAFKASMMYAYSFSFLLFSRRTEYGLDGTNNEVDHTQPQLTRVGFFGRIWRLGISGSRHLVSAMVDLAFGGWQSSKYPRL